MYARAERMRSDAALKLRFLTRGEQSGEIEKLAELWIANVR